MEIKEVENLIRRSVDSDLRENYGQDPLGDSLYLFFAQRKKLTSPSIDNLIDLMNNWVYKILVKKETSRFVDREITSAILAYSTLRKLSRLETQIDQSVLNELINIKDDYYFGNPTYSLLILLSTHNMRDKISFYDVVLDKVRQTIISRKNLSDAKNIVFGSLLFSLLNETESIRKLASYCLEKLSQQNIRFDDRVFYAWTLWNFRRTINVDILQVCDFVESTLENFCGMLQGIVTDETTIDFYGEDVHSRISKIVLGICLDLAIDYSASKLRTSAIDILSIIQGVQSLRWSEVVDLLKGSIDNFERGNTKECCDDLRMGLMTFLMKSYEKVVGTPAPINEGKTPDPTTYLQPLVQKNIISDFQKSTIRSSWAYASELAHVEKRGGNKPTENETRYCLQLVMASIELLLRSIEKVDIS